MCGKCEQFRVALYWTPGAGCRVPTGTETGRPDASLLSAAASRSHTRRQLVVPDVELARLAGALVLRPAQVEEQAGRRPGGGDASVRVQVEVSLAGRRPRPAGLVVGGVAVVLDRRPVDRALDRVRAPCRRAQDVAFRAGDERGRPLDPPLHREQLVGEPARVALARDLVQPARVVEIPPSALAGEDDVHRSRLRRTDVARAGGRPAQSAAAAATIRTAPPRRSMTSG